MKKDNYESERYMSLRSFTDIQLPVQMEVPKKRIQIVETRLIRKTSLLYERRTVCTPAMAAKLMKQLYESYDREYLYALYLTIKCEPIAVELISIGTLDATFICPKDILKTALLCSAYGFLIFHNHPSGGDVVASQEDVKATKRLRDASTLMGIKMIDHIIVSDTGYISLKEQELI